MPFRDSHCSYCGHPFSLDQPWPRACAQCGEMSFQNPAPVSVVLLPIDGGLLAVRRGIEPGWGQLSLPGGYINRGETWQQAGARELREETAIHLDPAEIRLFNVLSNSAGTFLIVFGLVGERTLDALKAFAPNEETLECVVLRQFQELAFSLHTQVTREFFERRAVRVAGA